MVRRFIFLLGLALAIAACGEASDRSTTTTGNTTTTETAPITTLAEITGTTQTPATTTTTATTTTATATTTAGPVVAVADIRVIGGTVERVERFDVPLDGVVRVSVTADTSDEIHLHGYDLHADVTPVSAAILEFDATIPGVFEIELEGSGVLIGELQVAP
jgi:ABC-type glycerol-3-phosphate transport system substrate-binding protein